MTRAHSAWHPQQQNPDGPPTALHSPAVPSDAGDASGDYEGDPMGPITDENGVMTDGAGVCTGAPLSNPALIEAISEDPILRWVGGGVSGRQGWGWGVGGGLSPTN